MKQISSKALMHNYTVGLLHSFSTKKHAESPCITRLARAKLNKSDAVLKHCEHATDQPSKELQIIPVILKRARISRTRGIALHWLLVLTDSEASGSSSGAGGSQSRRLGGRGSRHRRRHRFRGMARLAFHMLS